MSSLHFSSVYKIGLRFPRLVLIFSVLLALASIYYFQKLKIETDFGALLPKSTASVQNINRFREYFGSRGHLYTTVESEDADKAEQFADAFAAQIEKLPIVWYVDYRRPVQYFEDRQWLYLDLEDLQAMEHRVDRSLELQKQGVSPVFSDIMDFADKEDRPDLSFKDILKKYEDKYGSVREPYSSKDEGRFIVLRIKAKQDAQDFQVNRALVKKVKSIAATLKKQKGFEAIEVGYTGSYLTTIEDVDLLRREMTWVSIIVLVLLLLILFLYFGRMSGAFLVGMPLVVGVVWTGGLIYFILGHVNIITAFAVSILAGLGSDYGIYLLSRFKEEREKGVDFSQACDLSFGQTGKATWIAMITTVGAFVSLIISGFEVFKEFGIVGALGLSLNYLAMMLLIPSLLQIGQRAKEGSILARLLRWHPGKPRVSWSKAPPWLFPWKKEKALSQSRLAFSMPVIGLTIVLVILASLTLPTQSKIYFDNGQVENQDIPSRQLYDRIRETMGGTSLYPTMLMVEGLEADRKVVEGLEQQLKERPDQVVFDKVLGISTFIPNNQKEKRRILRRLIRKYPQNRFVNQKQIDDFVKSFRISLQAPEVKFGSLPEEIKRLFVSSKDPNFYSVYVFPSISRNKIEEMKFYREGILRSEAEVGIKFFPVAGSFVPLDLIDMITEEAPMGLMLILIFFSVVLVLTLRRSKCSAVILITLMSGLVLLSGLLYLFKIELNVLNIVIFPIILGTGIDSFIHFTHRYSETKNLSKALEQATPAILISNLTSIVGFGALMFTSSTGLRSIGYVSVIGLVLVTILAIFVFPRSMALVGE